MPAALTYFDQGSTDNATRQLLQAAEDERRFRQELLSTSWSYYEGKHPKPLKIKQDGTNNNVIKNLYAEAVDATVNFLFPDVPQISIDYGDGATASNTDPKADNPLETYLEAAIEYNGGLVKLVDMATMGGCGGHVFLRVVPDETKPYPRIILLDSDAVIIWYKQGDRDCVLWYELRFMLGREKRKIDFINEAELAPGVGQGWTLIEYAMRANKWEEQGREPWAYPVAPIIEWKNLPSPRSCYGRLTVRNVGLNDSVNRAASDIKAILRAHAAPKTIITGANEDEVPAAQDGLIAFEDKDVKVSNVEMTSDLASSQTFETDLAEQFFSEAKVTRLRGGPDAFKNVTNVGIKAAFFDMAANVKLMQKLYGRGLSDLFKLLLMLGGLLTPDEYTTIEVNLEFGNAIPFSESETTTTLQVQHDMGVTSLETAAQLLGRDYTAEQEKIQSEPETGMKNLNALLQAGGGSPTPNNSNLN